MSLKNNKVSLIDYIKEFENKKTLQQRAPLRSDGLKTKPACTLKSPKGEPTVPTTQKGPLSIKQQLKTGQLKSKLIRMQPKVTPLNISGIQKEENQTHRAIGKDPLVFSSELANKLYSQRGGLKEQFRIYSPRSPIKLPNYAQSVKGNCQSMRTTPHKAKNFNILSPDILS